MVENGARKPTNAVSDLEKTRTFRRQASHVFGLTLAQLCVPNGSVPEEALAWKKPSLISEACVLVTEIALALDVTALPAQPETDLKRGSSAKSSVETTVSSSSTGTRADLGQIVPNPQDVAVLSATLDRVFEIDETGSTLEDVNGSSVDGLPGANDDSLPVTRKADGVGERRDRKRPIKVGAKAACVLVACCQQRTRGGGAGGINGWWPLPTVRAVEREVRAIVFGERRRGPVSKG